MNKISTWAMLLMAFAVTGCASIMNDSTQPMRIETLTQSGVEVKDMDCKAENDMATQAFKSPGTVAIRRSSKDLRIVCTKPGESEARGVAISRANAGLAGNILIGGGIGAIIDHTKGTAYTYPQWIQLVIEKLITFDRRNDTDGKPNMGVVTASLPKPDDSKNVPSGSVNAASRPATLDDLGALLPKKP
jgi:hypothetical protein